MVRNKSNNKYKTGKIGHIYRPQLIDAKLNTSWGSWELRENNSVLRLIADKEWLAKATYPVIIDPEFGITAEPIEGVAVAANYMYGVVPPTAPASNGTADAIHFCVTYAVASRNAKGVLISADQTSIIDAAVGDAVSVTTGAAAWFTSTFSGTKPTVTSGIYDRPGIVADALFYHGYDYVGIDYPNDWVGRLDSTNNYATPANPGAMSLSNKRLCIHCTYTEAGGVSYNESRAGVLDQAGEYSRLLNMFRIESGNL